MIKTSLFTLKHYAAIIRVMRATRPNEHDCYHRSQEEWMRYVNALADTFSHDNPKFKRDAFIKACNEQVTEPTVR